MTQASSCVCCDRYLITAGRWFTMLVRVVLVGVAAGIAPEPRGASSIGDSFVRIIIMYFRS